MNKTNCNELNLASRKPKLGVVAISFNEERDLPGFIGHLIDWVDEIVIVDDGSRDQTPEIAKHAGAKVKLLVSPRQEGEYYSDQRNKGIAAATSDWLLHMDIDERVPPELANEIRAAICDPSKDAYKFRRLNYFLHRGMRGGGWQNWNQVHLAKRNIFRFEGMYHETCIVETSDDQIGQLDARMHHLNDECYSERLRKSATYVHEVASHFEKACSKNNQRMGVLRVLWVTLREFVYKYIYQFGFRDGRIGILAALHSTSATFRAAMIVWDKHNRIERATIENQLKDEWKRSVETESRTR